MPPCIKKWTEDEICALIDAKVSAADDAGLVKLGQGDTYPTGYTPDPITVQTPNGPVDVVGGEALPADMIGCVWYDPDEPGAAIYVGAAGGESPVFQDGDGNPIAPVGTDPDGNPIYCFTENGVVDVACVQRSVQETTAKGDTFCHNATFGGQRGILLNTPVTIDENTPTGPIPTRDGCRTVAIPKCGGRVRGLYTSGKCGEGFPEPPTKGNNAQFVGEFSDDGGATFAEIPGAGNETVFANGGEFGSTRQFTTDFLVGGVATVCAREVFKVQTLSDGAQVILTPASVLMNAIEEVCC